MALNSLLGPNQKCPCRSVHALFRILGAQPVLQPSFDGCAVDDAAGCV